MNKTITSIFMIPTLGITKGGLVDNGFINAYSKDNTYDLEYVDCVFLLFKPEDLSVFREFLDNEYEFNKRIVDDYDYEGGYVVLVYKLDPTYKVDFDLVRLGKYSKTSKEFQKLFPKVVKIIVNGLRRDEISLQYRIFNKTNDLIEFWEQQFDVVISPEQEVWHGFIEKNEVLDCESLETISESN